jgi:hypothetical protein
MRTNDNVLLHSISEHLGKDYTILKSENLSAIHLILVV